MGPPAQAAASGIQKGAIHTNPVYLAGIEVLRNNFDPELTDTDSKHRPRQTWLIGSAHTQTKPRKRQLFNQSNP